MAENHHSDREPPLGRFGPGVAQAPRWLVAAALFALVPIFYWKLAIFRSATWLAGNDQAYQVLPWLEMQAREWHAGRIPLWDPYHWLGQPLLAQAQPAVAMPLNWLLSFLPFQQEWLCIRWLHWYFIALHWIGAAGAYRLARSLGCRREAALFGALCFSLSGWFAQALRPQMAASAMWAPFLLRHLLESLRGRDPSRSAVLGGFFLGLCWLGGHHQIPIFLSVACLLLWLGELRRRWRPAVLFLLMAGATSALQMLPALEYGRLAVRWVGAGDPVAWSDKIPYRIHAAYSLSRASLFAIVWPRFQEQLDPFLGATALVLALAGAFALRRDASIRRLAFLAGLGAALSLGPAGGIHRVFYALVPHFDKARSPSAAIFLFGLAASALAAAGLHVLLVQPRRWPAVAALACAAWAGAGSLARALQGGGGSLPPGALLAGVIFASAAAACLLSCLQWRLATSWIAVCFVALLLAEIYPVSTYTFAPLNEPAHTAALASLDQHRDVAAFLKRQPGYFRVDVDDSAVPYNFGDWHGLAQAKGYLASLTTNVYRHELHTSWAQHLFGVRFRVARAPSESHNRVVFQGAGGLKVFATDNVLPRAFIVHEVYQLTDRRQAAGELYTIGGETGRRAFVPAAPPALDRCAGADSAWIVSYQPGRVLVRARAACRGMLVLTDTWYPGWRARVDGRRAAIYEAYAVVRGVVVGPGEHTVEFRFRPASVYAGAALSLLGLAAAVLSAWPVRLHW